MKPLKTKGMHWSSLHYLRSVSTDSSGLLHGPFCKRESILKWPLLTPHPRPSTMPPDILPQLWG